MQISAKTRLVSVIGLGLILLAVNTAWAQDDKTGDAAAAYQEGKVAFEAGDFDTALQRFTEAYNISGKVDLLYNLAVCSEKTGNLEKALSFYELYLEEKPDAQDAVQVRARITALKSPPALPEASPEETVAPATDPQDDGQAETGASPEPLDLGLTQETQKKNPGPGLVIGGGALVTVSGLLTTIGAWKKHNAAEVNCAPECSDAEVSEVKKISVTADVLIFTGAAVMVGGIIWALVEKKGESRVNGARLRAAPAVADGFGGLVFEGRF